MPRARSVVDLYILYQFVKRLSTPFTKWKMYEVGLIDDEGNFVVDKDQRTPEQKAAYTHFDVLILNLKKLIAKVPGGSSRIATFAAALFMLREGRYTGSLEGFDLQEYVVRARDFLTEEGEGGGAAVPTNNMGGGYIADNKKGLPYTKNKSVLKRKKIGVPKTLKEYFLLMENRVDYLRDKYIPKLADQHTVYFRHSDRRASRIVDEQETLKVAEEVFEWLMHRDPTSNKIYLEWLLKYYLKMGATKFVQDVGSITDAIHTFDQVKRYLPGNMRDINRYKTHQEIDAAVEPYINHKSNRAIKAEEVKKWKSQIVTIYEGSAGRIYVPRTEEASCFLGRGTKWCTAFTEAPNYFRSYNQRGPLYVILLPNGRKYQWHLTADHLTDELDVALNVNEWLHDHLTIAKAIINDRNPLLRPEDIISLIEKVFSDKSPPSLVADAYKISPRLFESSNGMAALAHRDNIHLFKSVVNKVKSNFTIIKYFMATQKTNSFTAKTYSDIKEKEFVFKALFSTLTANNVVEAFSAFRRDGQERGEYMLFLVTLMITGYGGLVTDKAIEHFPDEYKVNFLRTAETAQLELLSALDNREKDRLYRMMLEQLPTDKLDILANSNFAKKMKALGYADLVDTLEAKKLQEFQAAMEAIKALRNFIVVEEYTPTFRFGADRGIVALKREVFADGMVVLDITEDAYMKIIKAFAVAEDLKDISDKKVGFDSQQILTHLLVSQTNAVLSRWKNKNVDLRFGDSLRRMLERSNIEPSDVPIHSQLAAKAYHTLNDNLYGQKGHDLLVKHKLDVSDLARIYKSVVERMTGFRTLEP